MDFSNEHNVLARDIMQTYWNINRASVKLSQHNAASLGITLAQMAILNTLMLSPNVTLKELTERLMSPKSTVSVNIDGLVQSGLVVRDIPEENRREVKLTLTPEGKDTARKSMENANSYRAMAAILDTMSEEDRTELLRINKEILRQLEASVQAAAASD
ncbi:MarR family winged helix-turn-helix transcriptional regulator [Paenibacillus sp. NPDC056579]|uniref:MarR family winged helix-turn-helix transcriptional regulator n=1 Tax=Paenibacillus sp. NPDC056579 TaxID=3345871 RepID=UPI0036948A2C